MSAWLGRKSRTRLTVNSLTAPTPPRTGASSDAGKVGILSKVAWEPTEDNIDFRAWQLEGIRIGAIGRGSNWWIGDWLLYGNTRWGEQYAAARGIIGMDAKSLRNIRYVASRVEPAQRHEKLTWSHHAMLACMAPEEQDFWLGRAESDRLSVEDLRIELRAAERNSHSRETPPQEAPASGPTVICPKCRHEVPIPRHVADEILSLAAAS
jgi:hypothetical protein